MSMSPDFKIPTSQQWSFGIQRELTWGLTIDTSYVGSHGTHLLRALRINQTNAGAAASTAAAYQIVPFKGYGTITQRSTTASSRYDSLQVALNKKSSKGFTFGVAYTFSKTIADASSDRNYPDVPQWRDNMKAERALVDYDKPQVFVANWMYELPFFKNSRKLLYNTLGGWQFGGLWRFESGTPLTIIVSGSQANSFFGYNYRPNLVADPNGAQTVDHWFNQAAFAAPAPNTFGNAPRSIVRGPGVNLADMTIYKNFKVHERLGMQFRAEMFNIFNHTNWGNPTTTVGLNVDPTKDYWHNLDANGNPTSANPSPNFGRITSSLQPRQIQLGLKVNF